MYENPYFGTFGSWYTESKNVSKAEAKVVFGSVCQSRNTSKSPALRSMQLVGIKIEIGSCMAWSQANQRVNKTSF
jgi:hypothetical protein